jgi:hypothetical protein
MLTQFQPPELLKNLSAHTQGHYIVHAFKSEANCSGGPYEYADCDLSEESVVFEAIPFL